MPEHDLNWCGFKFAVIAKDKWFETIERFAKYSISKNRCQHS